MSNTFEVSVHNRRCTMCGAIFGTLATGSLRSGQGLMTYETRYKSKSLPLEDHVHDDTSQDLSSLKTADESLQPCGRDDSRRVSKVAALLQGDHTRSLPCRRAGTKFAHEVADWLDSSAYAQGLEELSRYEVVRSAQLSYKKVCDKGPTFWTPSALSVLGARLNRLVLDLKT